MVGNLLRYIEKAAGNGAHDAAEEAARVTKASAQAVTTARVEAQAFAAALRVADGRTPAAAAAAVDRQTGNVFLGHSGETIEVPVSLRSRLPDPSLEPWSATNCAEVAAYSRALSGGASFDDLTVWTVRTRTGEYFPPCDNCSTWLPGRKR